MNYLHRPNYFGNSKLAEYDEASWPAIVDLIFDIVAHRNRLCDQTQGARQTQASARPPTKTWRGAMTLPKLAPVNLNGDAAVQLNDAEMKNANAELDLLAIAVDERNAIGARIMRLASLNPIERAKEIRAMAKELGVPVAAVEQAVKQAGPVTDTKGQGRPVELPEIEPWPVTINGAALLSEIRDVIRQYLVLPSGGAEVLALWAIHTHIFECFGHSPRLAITSPEKGCGKTTTLDVLAELVARPLCTSNATVSAVFRIVEMAKPTLLIDEADTFLKENDELRGILKCWAPEGRSSYPNGWRRPRTETILDLDPSGSCDDRTTPGHPRGSSRDRQFASKEIQ